MPPKESKETENELANEKIQINLTFSRFSASSLNDEVTIEGGRVTNALDVFNSLEIDNTLVGLQVILMQVFDLLLGRHLELDILILRRVCYGITLN